MTNKALVFLLSLLVFNLSGRLICFSQNTATAGAKGKQVEIVNANTIEYDSEIADAKRLIGDVAFRQDNVFLYCDSAYFYSNTNSIDAYGHIHIVQGDTIHAYGNFLNYTGNIKLAELTGNVKLVDKEMILTTDHLFYDTGKNIANYTSGAKIINKENTLTSTCGYYYANQKNLYFKKKVVLTNPKYVMNCDTLRYNTTSKTAYFMSPSTIKGKDNYIYCEDGYYDTSKDIAELHQNSYLENKEKRIRGNFLYYDRKKGNGYAKEEVTLTDTTQKMEVSGLNMWFNEKTGTSTITGKTLFKQILGKDTLYLHADTLKAINDTVQKKKTVFAYYKVKFFKKDMQGKCDSLVYAFSDSLIKLYKKPILWNEENQISSDTIIIENSKSGFKSFSLYNASFIIAESDSNRYNQIKGLNMKGYFKEGDLRKIEVKGNGQTIYFPEDDKKKEILGLNRSDCRDLTIYLNDSNKVERITFVYKPESTLYPLKDALPEHYYLTDFKWLEAMRPKNISDIFKWE